MKSKVEYCPKTDKYCYSSEAKATRAVNRYCDIQRCYYCEHCDSFHTTSLSEEKALEEGIITEKKTASFFSAEHISRELKRLTNFIGKQMTCDFIEEDTE